MLLGVASTRFAGVGANNATDTGFGEATRWRPLQPRGVTPLTTLSEALMGERPWRPVTTTQAGDAVPQLTPTVTADAEVMQQEMALPASLAGVQVHTEARRAYGKGPRYSLELLKSDLETVLQTHLDNLSPDPLGNPANLQLWSDDKIHSFYHGMRTAKLVFYNDIPFYTLARMILAEAAQESTGDYRLNVRKIDYTDHAGLGLLQVTPASVVWDYKCFGTAVRNDAGQTVLDPQTIDDVDLADPGINVVLWAWYTRNTLDAGVSINEWAHQEEWNVDGIGAIPRDLGNAMFTWLGGPRSDRHAANHNERWDIYALRIKAYWVAAKWGSESDFDQNLDLAVPPRLLRVRKSVNPQCALTK